MNFDNLKKQYLTEQDMGQEIPPDQTIDPEAELQEKIAERMMEIGEKASKKLDKIIADKTNLFITRVQKVGIDEVLYDFVVNKFIPELTDIDEKLFVTINLDDFIMFLVEKFSEKLIGDGSTAKKQEGKTDETKVTEEYKGRGPRGFQVPKFPADDEKFFFQLSGDESTFGGQMRVQKMTLPEVAAANKKLKNLQKWIPADLNFKKKYKFKNNLETLKYIEDNY